MSTVELTGDNFENTIQDNDIVIVDYWAEWCGPCKAFGPIFEKVAESHPDVTFAKCDTEKEQSLAGALQIRSIPTLMIFREGVLLFSQPGMVPEAALEELVTKTRELDMEEVKRKIKEEEAKIAAKEEAKKEAESN